LPPLMRVRFGHTYVTFFLALETVRSRSRNKVARLVIESFVLVIASIVSRRFPLRLLVRDYRHATCSGESRNLFISTRKGNYRQLVPSSSEFDRVSASRRSRKFRSNRRASAAVRGNVGEVAGGKEGGTEVQRVVINEVAGATSPASLEVVPSRLGAIRGHFTGSSAKRTTPRLREASASPLGGNGGGGVAAPLAEVEGSSREGRRMNALCCRRDREARRA